MKNSIYSKEEISRLLARGEIPASMRESILKKTLKNPAIKSSRTRGWFGSPGLAVGAFAALFLLLVGSFFYFSSLPGEVERQASFQSKGLKKDSFIEVGCIFKDQVSQSICQYGSSLVFRADGINRPVYLAAYVKDHSGNLTWYFPTEDSFMPILPPHSGPQWVNQSFVIGDELPMGRLELILGLYTNQLSRDEILVTKPLHQQHVVLEVIQ